MYTLGLMSVAIIIVSGIFSYKGFTNHHFFDRYKFNVDAVLIQKEYKRLITSGFLHVNWMHLIFNMLSLYFFSSGLENFIGGIQFALIYLAGLIGGNLLALVIHRHQGDYSAVGASGAVSAIIFASIALFPDMSIGLFLLPISMPAWVYGLAFVLISIYGIRSRSDNVGHDAHLGGGLTGLVIAILMYPQAIQYNYLPILLIAVPSVVFIFIIVRKPHMLLIDNLHYKKHQFTNVDHQYNTDKRSKQMELDHLLDKIHKKGIKSLTKEEREKLKSLSR